MVARFLYRIFKREFEAFMVEDMLMQIPDKVHRPFIELMGARKDMMRKWIFFEVNSLLTRPPIHQTNPDRRQGMLMVFQALLLAITDAKSSMEELPNGTEIPARKEPVIVDTTYLSAIESFKNNRRATVEK